MPGQTDPQESVRQKLSVVGLEFKGKNVMIVDDSIVRGTTSREIVQMAREAGASNVFFASAAPPVRFPNVYGIDMPTRSELIATGRNEEQVAREIGPTRSSIRIWMRSAAVRGGQSEAHAVRDFVFRRGLHYRRRDERIPRLGRAAARRRPSGGRGGL